MVCHMFPYFNHMFPYVPILLPYIFHSFTYAPIPYVPILVHICSIFSQMLPYFYHIFSMCYQNVPLLYQMFTICLFTICWYIYIYIYSFIHLFIMVYQMFTIILPNFPFKTSIFSGHLPAFLPAELAVLHRPPALVHVSRRSPAPWRQVLRSHGEIGSNKWYNHGDGIYDI